MVWCMQVLDPFLAGVTVEVGAERAQRAVTAGVRLTKTALTKRRVAQLREMCAARGLVSEGTKPKLVQRLLASDKGKAGAAAAPAVLALTEAMARNWCIMQWGAAKAHEAATRVCEGAGGAVAVSGGHLWKMCAAVGVGPFWSSVIVQWTLATIFLRASSWRRH